MAVARHWQDRNVRAVIATEINGEGGDNLKRVIAAVHGQNDPLLCPARTNKRALGLRLYNGNLVRGLLETIGDGYGTMSEATLSEFLRTQRYSAVQMEKSAVGPFESAPSSTARTQPRLLQLMKLLF